MLGTTFNVLKRKKRARVVLSTGKVRLTITQDKEKDSLIMHPGELVELNDTARNYLRKPVNPHIYSSWKGEKLQFDNTSLKDIKLLLEESYGLNVQVESPQLLELKLTGSVPNKNVNSLLNGLSRLFNLEIKKLISRFGFIHLVDN